ncbi:carboxyltransferase domain-containing protein [Nocardia sp. NBC_00508]|uniref:5-oxoprolinase subunit B family protein n=1 Tax=Nocardia sp. NBC_00508 TaxID=2975992 RepID=UPI002E8147D5|nr:carboxyltransferase domain-containing protein [Nocardia sp. NBC_00508]WUD65865.1 carboxyltransferase domain-containing protein [Nocardia sp. NBC_00508]
MTTGGIRYSFGGDEWLLAELAPEMSFVANLRATAITRRLNQRRPEGIVEVCPSNASYQVRFDPERLDPRQLLELLRELEGEVSDVTKLSLSTRILELPVFYRDPWTHEIMMRFRDYHQEPTLTDSEYAARINGFADADEFEAAHTGSPWFTSMMGFVAGVPWLYQMVPRARQLVVPKYVRPRTATPALTIGHGGCFGCIYSVPGAGGFQMFGITPAPIYDPLQRGPDFADFVAFFRPGDIVKYRAIARDEYDAIRADVEAGHYRIRQHPVTLDVGAYLADPDASNARLTGALDGD